MQIILVLGHRLVWWLLDDGIAALSMLVVIIVRLGIHESILRLLNLARWWLLLLVWTVFVANAG